MKIAFRTDASCQIGTGHFIRCLTLACKLKKQGAYISFLSRNLPTHLSDMLNEKEMEYIPLDNHEIKGSADELMHSRWLGISQMADSQDTIKALSSQIYDWIVVDHYALDVQWENIVRPNAKKMKVIDDLADRNHDCDILLDQNYFADMQTRYIGKTPEHCVLLAGPRYALLREEFKVCREKVELRNGEIKKILVFFGGVDVDNCTLQVIEVLSEINIGFQVDVVIGAQHPFKELIKSACAEHGYVCHIQTSRMAELMLEADLAIGAGGSASWERCCLGLPSLLFALADNQITIAKELDSINAAVYMGNNDVVSFLNFKKTLNKLLNAPELTQKMSENAYSIVDGLGVDRITNEMRVCS
jgi:UDP-2,4-diacetamido-2,4,6-trideoxy-beta-L-altropyranose hydrolase